MSTFSRLYRLASYPSSNPMEDYLTELLAPIFKDSKFLTSFLEKFADKHFESIGNIRVSTQKTYLKILDHETDSRPDLIVSFETRKGKHLMFFENKLGAGEGVLQLKRYHDHLQEHYAKGYDTYLFYITKIYDPKEKKNETQKGTAFFQTQWFRIYHWLTTFKEDIYVNELLSYMEENELDNSRVFTPSDIHALQQLPKMQKMLDETLDGKVKRSFEELFGRAMQWQNRAKQLRDRDRYVLYSDQSDWKYIGCGYWFMDGEYPDISIFLEVESNCQNRKELLEAIERFCNEYPDWELEGPEDGRDYFILYYDRSMKEFLSCADHIESFQDFMIEKLTELHSLKQQLPQLKWGE